MSQIILDTSYISYSYLVDCAAVVVGDDIAVVAVVADVAAVVVEAVVMTSDDSGI